MKDLQSSAGNFITAILVACALVTTGLVIRRELLFSTQPSGATVEQKAVYIDNWVRHLNNGVRMGPIDAPVQLIEFADFECPFCASFHRILKTIEARYPGKIALIFVHYPIETHRLAEHAARVAECAGDQGRFAEMHDQLFQEQQHLGVKAWSELAVAAGVPDIPAFQYCIDRKDTVSRVTEGQKLGRLLDIKGTPTLVVNGWKLGRPPAEHELVHMVDAILAGRSPMSGDGKKN